MNKFVYRTLCKNYEQSAMAVLAEYRKYRYGLGIGESEIFQEYEENLKLLRLFLDNEGVVMPRPKWHYNDKDESTWLFTHRKGINKTFLMLQPRRR